ncbi:MAG: phage tail tube protein [Mycobacteriaceae bacterium]
MAKDRANIRTYGDDASAVYVAPKGTTGPTTLAAPGVGFTEVGWLSEDGVDFDRSTDRTTYRGFQGAAVVKVKTVSVEDTFKFVCLEETATTLGLAFAGVTPTTATGVDTFAITNQAKSDERAWVVDLIDGTVTKRYVVPAGNAELTGTIAHKNSDMTMYEFTVTINGAYNILKTAAA